MNETTTKKVVMQWLNALSAGDFDNALACLDDNIRWVNCPGVDGKPGGIPGLSAIVPWFGDFQNKSEVVATFGPYGAAQETLDYERLNIMVRKDQAMVLIREKARIKATGDVYEIEFVQRYQVAGERIVLLRAYLDSCRMVEAFRGDMPTRLPQAARLGDTETAAKILPNGANPNQTEADSGETALIIAVRQDHCEMVRMLLAHGAEPNLITRKSGDTALHVAAESGNSEMVRVLLAAGAMINIQRPTTGETPLHLAMKAGYRDCVALLLDHGASMDATAFDGTRVGDLAKDVVTTGPERVTRFV